MPTVNGVTTSLLIGNSTWLNILCCCLCYEKTKSEAKKAHRFLSQKRQNENRTFLTPEAVSSMSSNAFPAQGII